MERHTHQLHSITSPGVWESSSLYSVVPNLVGRTAILDASNTDFDNAIPFATYALRGPLGEHDPYPLSMPAHA